MNRTVRIISLIAAAVIAVIAIAVAVSKQGCQEPTYKIFGSLNEFSCFDNYEKKELPDNFELTDGLGVGEHRCFSVSFEGYDFNVYAYVFSSAEDAAAFKQRCENGGLAENVLYSVCDGSRALLVTGGEKRSAQFLNYLFDNLTVPVEYHTDKE